MPSWQSKIASIVIRALFKRRPPESESDAVAFVRGMIKERPWMRRPILPGISIRPVDDNRVRGEWIESDDRVDCSLGGRVSAESRLARSCLREIRRAADWFWR